MNIWQPPSEPRSTLRAVIDEMHAELKSYRSSPKFSQHVHDRKLRTVERLEDVERGMAFYAQHPYWHEAQRKLSALENAHGKCLAATFSVLFNVLGNAVQIVASHMDYRRDR